VRIVIIVGAGSTLSDAVSLPLKRRPPLDKGFFTACGKLDLPERLAIIRYLKRNYDIDPTSEEHDSLERIMAIIYADIGNPLLDKKAVSAFRGLIRLFNRRIAETTNSLIPTNRTNLYRILAKKFNNNASPSDISIITFNQDIQIEKVLSRLEKTKAYRRLGPIFCFPACYRIKDASDRLSRPPRSLSKFKIDRNGSKGIPVLKLHGSLNWFSSHTSSKVPKNAILKPKKDFYITPRLKIPVEMTFTKNKKKTYTFPLIIPPVNHKVAIIHRDIHPIWELAEDALTKANEIIVFGYSCPAADFESANLFRRAIQNGANQDYFSVIDPAPQVFQRYVDITSLDHLSYFRSADAYIEKG